MSNSAGFVTQFATRLETAETSTSPLFRVEPWRNLTKRIRNSLDRHRFYVASSDDLSVLWSGEKIDAIERRRRITFFAAQHHWKVDARADGRAARFHSAQRPPSFVSEHLSRNHE
jgi:hypothetical protein